MCIRDRPHGALASQIQADFGGLAKLEEELQNAAVTQFGSGWAWLVEQDGKLAIGSTPNQDNPLMLQIAAKTGTPVLGLDVWEHAYYLKHQNKRGDYLKGWWQVVNWERVNPLFGAAIQ